MQANVNGVFKATGDPFEITDSRTNSVVGVYLSAQCQEDDGKQTEVAFMMPPEKKLLVKRGEGFRLDAVVDYRVSTDQKTGKLKPKFRLVTVKSFKLVRFQTIDL